MIPPIDSSQKLHFNAQIKDVTFDLSELANIVGDLQATDGDIPATMNFEGNQSYVLSVCGDVSTGKPPICTSQGEAAASCYSIWGSRCVSWCRGHNMTSLA